MQKIAALALVLLLLPSTSGARSHAAKAAFQREHPCPSTSAQRGKCPGYVIDHITPLCAHGPDDPSNMQWQTIKEAKIKDREERKMCKANNNR